MIRVAFQEDLEPPWTEAPSTPVGPTPRPGQTPDLYVTVTGEDSPLLRVDVYTGCECRAFQEVLVWNGAVVIGYGSRVHVVALESRTVRSIEFGSYFCELYASEDYLLIASGRRLFRLDPEGSVIWASEWLGIDGVEVERVEGDRIYGQGEWDPPGGWQPFVVSLASGEVEQPLSK